MATTIAPTCPREWACPREWEGRARRVTVSNILAQDQDGTEFELSLRGWELMEDIEGYCKAGQIWFDEEEESIRPAGSWIIEPFPRDGSWIIEPVR